MCLSILEIPERWNTVLPFTRRGPFGRKMMFIATEKS
jgi:hypothetical protein